MDCGLKPLTLV
jgi:hypothetical protein